MLPIGLLHLQHSSSTLGRSKAQSSKLIGTHQTEGTVCRHVQATMRQWVHIGGMCR